MLKHKNSYAIFAVALLSLAVIIPDIPLSLPHFISNSSFSANHSGSDPSGTFTLNPGWSESFSIDLLSGMNATFTVLSSAPLNVYFMSSAQFSKFESTGTAQALYEAEGSSVKANLGPFIAGTYYLVMLNNVSSQQARISFSLSTLPVDIYSVHSSLPSAVGIADYGVLNSSGVLKPYKVLFDEVIGTAEIYSIEAYNATPPSGISSYGASLQQNVVLQVNTTSGNYEYWLQNVAGFITNVKTFNVWDNVWNYTSYPSILYSNNITGNGFLHVSHEGLFYAYATPSASYSLPFSINLYISIERSQNSVRVDFGYSTGSSTINWYDSVTITQSGIENASLLISGYKTAPNGMFYDSELVFGGEGNGEITNFTAMSANLFMKYRLSNGTYVQPKELYGFGSDTAEAADDLSSFLMNGRPTVEVGRGNFEPLYRYVPSGPFRANISLSAAADAGAEVSVMLSFSLYNGMAPYTFYFYIDGKPVYNFTTFFSQYNGTVYLPPLSAGNHSLYAEVYDALGGFANSSVYTITVNPDPVTFLKCKNVTDVDLPINISMFAYNGTPPYSYHLYADGELVSNGTSYSSILGYRVIVPSSSGQLGIKLVVKDSAGFSITYNYRVTVNPDPRIAISLQQTVYDVGQAINVSELISSGTTPYRVILYVNGTPVNSSALLRLRPGTYILYANLTDSAGFHATSNSVELKVNPSPVITYSYRSASNSMWIVNSIVTVNALVENGTPPYSYSWYLNGQEVSSANSSTYTYKLTTMGPNLISVKVRDGAGYTASASFMVDYGYNFLLIGLLAALFLALLLGVTVIKRVRTKNGQQRPRQFS